MKLIITRHGETEENKAGIIMGHLHGTLSENGKEQAKKVALRLKEEKIDAIYSSDLARSSDTAKEIAKYHPKTPLIFAKDLREKYLGEWQGKNKKDLGFTSNTSLVELSPKDGETNEELFNRARDFLHKTLLVHVNDTVLFVGHNGIGKALIAVITGKKFNDIKAIENLHNTSINIFDINEDKSHKIHLFNCSKHLE